jgi:hypothetical protein
MTISQTEPGKRRWLYPVMYVLFLVISAIPAYAEKPFAPQDTLDVILSLYRVSLRPYEHLAPIFHLATLLIVVLIALERKGMGRVLAAYVGLNYLVIAFVQTMGTTKEYGFVVHSGALVVCILLGIAWIVVAFRGELEASYANMSMLRWLLLPLAVLAFWSPYDAEAQPYFNPMLLLTSSGYGLTFCFTTPVFLFLLVLFYPKVNPFVYRITAFNGLLYGLINMSHFRNPELRWMGALHLPLLVISACALSMPAIGRRKGGSPGQSPP